MFFFDFIFHLDKNLANIISFFGNWTYVLLLVIVFAETGLVVFPFLPGDSLLFAVGALGARGFLNISLAYLALLAAAILGDTVNYWVGHNFGLRSFKDNSKLLNKKQLEKTQEFYQKHGKKTIILARFIPIIRTFAPFVAGLGKMNYSTFVLYNVIGAFLWVTLLTFAGYFFGELPIVKNNFEYVVLGIIGVSFLPVIVEYAKHKRVW